MAKYDCEEIQELLYDYAENLLPVRQKTIVAHHLGKCAACSSKELSQIKQIISLLQNLPEEPLPQDFDEKLHLALIAAASNIDEGNFKPKAASAFGETVSEEKVEPIKLNIQDVVPKKPIWQRAYFPRSMAAAIILFFGIISASYANDYFGFWNFSSGKVLNQTSSLEIGEQPICDTAADEGASAAAFTKAAEPNTERNISAAEGAGLGEDALPAGSTDNTTAKAFSPVGICGDAVSLASREGSGVHEYMPLLPETPIKKNSVDKGSSNMSFNSHMASGEAADKNYYWQDYDYAKLMLLTKNKEDVFKQAAIIAKNFKGYICNDFYDYNKDVALTEQNSVMLDIPVDDFDNALTKLSALGDIKSCYLPDEDTDKTYTFKENSITYRSILIIF